MCVYGQKVIHNLCLFKACIIVSLCPFLFIVSDAVHVSHATQPMASDDDGGTDLREGLMYAGMDGRFGHMGEFEPSREKWDQYAERKGHFFDASTFSPRREGRPVCLP